MRFFRFLFVVVLAISAWQISAQSLNLKQNAPEVYTVKKGDTLWDIAGLYLDKPWLWPNLWRNNSDILNPHLIYPGDQIMLRFNEKGEPELSIVREEPKPVVKLTPSGRKEVKPLPVDTLPWSIIAPYLEKAQLMSEEEYERLPHLMGNQDGTVLFPDGDLVLTNATNMRGEERMVVRRQNEVVDIHGNVLGVQVRHVADANPVDSDLDRQQLVNIANSNLEVIRGDKLYQSPELPSTSFALLPATSEKGFIVDNLEQRKLLGKFDVVIIDLGQDDVKQGTVMGIYQQGPRIIGGDSPKYENENAPTRNAFSFGNEIEQPALKTGELVVFRVFENASYALITQSTKVIKRGAIVAKP